MNRHYAYAGLFPCLCSYAIKSGFLVMRSFINGCDVINSTLHMYCCGTRTEPGPAKIISRKTGSVNYLTKEFLVSPDVCGGLYLALIS